ncbi:MarR family winged helix-turn-helix transcriptional regulator [Alteraurantiacibacter buctensis]|uniref:MarR family transcriptional regulator n=1 Tax=Alteraurantiacibacter buctensis TaxID=1503981 RepID=A0A844YUZ1_9SPHN|nr:MarR family transcriptional regulator [Alteraurantiacibacter buctensis]MXO70846.1 MarR family transcriptional regulator [Alteraurantiacibacter buctensis]
MRVGGAKRDQSGLGDEAQRRAPRLANSDLDYGLLKDVVGFPIKVVWILGYTLLTRTIDDPPVTPQRFSMLELIGCNPGAQQTQLGAALGLSRSATTITIDFWQDRGCVERRSVPGNRRIYGIYLTEAGRETWAALRQKVRRSDAELTKNLTPEEVGQLRGLLAKIHQ